MNNFSQATSSILMFFSGYDIQSIDEIFPGVGIVPDRFEDGVLRLWTFRNNNRKKVFHNLFSMGFCPLKNQENFFTLGQFNEGDIYFDKNQNKFYLRFEAEDERNKEHTKGEMILSSKEEWKTTAEYRYHQIVTIPENLLGIKIDLMFNIILSGGAVE